MNLPFVLSSLVGVELVRDEVSGNEGFSHTIWLLREVCVGNGGMKAQPGRTGRGLPEPRDATLDIPLSVPHVDTQLVLEK